jgi:hypothetical protein
LAVSDEIFADLADPANLIFIHIAPVIAFRYCTCHWVGLTEAVHFNVALFEVIFVVVKFVVFLHVLHPSSTCALQLSSMPLPQTSNTPG